MARLERRRQEEAVAEEAERVAMLEKRERQRREREEAAERRNVKCPTSHPLSLSECVMLYRFRR